MTVQPLPAAVGVRVEPETEHPPLTTDHDTAPVPEPPDATRETGIPTVPELVTTVSAVWFALPIVTVVFAEVAAL
jgi:hypothetical protein